MFLLFLAISFAVILVGYVLEMNRLTDKTESETDYDFVE